MTLHSQIQHASPYLNCRLVLDYKLILYKCNVNNTRFLGLEVCAVGKQALCSAQNSLLLYLSEQLQRNVRNTTLLLRDQLI